MRAITLVSRTVVGEGTRRDARTVWVWDPRTTESRSEDAKFFAMAAFTFLGPAIGYSLTIGGTWPFYWMACNLIMGVALGLLMYWKSAGGFLSCVPPTWRWTPSMPVRFRRGWPGGWRQFGPPRRDHALC